MNSKIQWAITFGADILAAIIGSKISHDGDNGGKKAPESNRAAVLEGIVRKITDNDRHNLFIFIEGMKNQVASANLMKRHKDCKRKAGKEDKWVNAMTRLYLVVKDDPTKHWIFEKLGTIEEEEFDQALYFFENDVIKQWFDKAKKVLSQIDLAVAGFVKPLSQALTAYAINNRASKGYAPNRFLRQTKEGE